jgi:L-lactate dehydrogenase complex protein LldG
MCNEMTNHASINSKQVILDAIRRQPTPEAALPEVARGDWIRFDDSVKQFATVLAAVGGNCICTPSIDDVRRELEQMPAFAAAVKVYSLVEGIANRNAEPSASRDPHALEDIDFAILPGHLAVAENAAVWVTDEKVIHRAIYFIAQHVALVVPAAQVVDNMHQAYERISFDRGSFGCFISGPSKTADIEQSLVIGAHGPRSLTVFLVGVQSQ